MITFINKRMQISLSKPGFIILFVLCSMLFKTSYCQEIVNNNPSEKYRPIEGTKVKLLAPIGFELATNFKGMQNSSKTAAISVIESTTPYVKFIDAAIPNIIKNASTNMVEIADYIINNRPAKLYSGTQIADNGATFGRIYLVLDLKNKTLALNGHFPLGDKDLEAKIQQGILSVIYDPNATVNLNLGYNIDLTNSDYSIASTSGAAITYSKSKSRNNAPPTFITMRRTLQQPQQDLESYVLNQIVTLKFKTNKIVYSKPIAIDGMNGVEMLLNLTEKTSNKDTQGYFIALSDPQYAYLLIGYNLTGNAVEEMRNIYMTLKRK